MHSIALSTYVLIWPAVVGVVLFFLVRAFFREWRKARQENRPMI